MLKKKFVPVFCCFLFLIKTKAEKIVADSVGEIVIVKAEHFVPLQLNSEENFSCPNTFLQRIKEKIGTNKKFIAAALAFPLPLGIVGAHRIYFGSQPYIPIVYIATVGGCFGILPLIDFAVILFTKKENLGKFERNNKIFMWAE